MPLIECIPNFSEARRPEVVDQIAAAVQSVGGVKLLDRSSDLDHNRTVLTFVGAPDAVEQAAFRAIQTAAGLIDLNQHTGAHPRIGATDVVPFVPLVDATMDECVAIAKRLGERVGNELMLPVYLYEAAARRPERVQLENIRRGQYEGLKAEIESHPDRAPDYGPARLGPAGATVIGARNPLVAFNVYLNTTDEDIAKKIAAAVRFSSGGLRYVKALGMSVDGRAQVSMNLTDIHETPIARVVEMVRREAARHGARIAHTELIGLIPQAALTDAALWYLQLDGFDRGQILEARLYDDGTAASLPEPASTFLDEIAAPTPAPGGGAAAAYAAALGAGLVAMVAGLTIDRPDYSAVHAEMQAIRVLAEKLRADLTQAVDDDASAVEAVMGAYRLPKGSQTEKNARAPAIRQAILNAVHIPMQVAEKSVRVIDLALKCAKNGNANAVSDAASSAVMAQAALTAAGWNIRTNLKTLEDRSVGKRILRELREMEKKAGKIVKEIQTATQERGGI